MSYILVERREGKYQVDRGHGGPRLRVELGSQTRQVDRDQRSCWIDRVIQLISMRGKSQ